MLNSERSTNFESARRIVVTLHGYGACGDDFRDSLFHVMRNKLDDTLFFFPDAPYKCDIGFGRQWFALPEVMTYKSLRDGLDLAGPSLFSYLNQLSKECNVPLENIDLIGFSQGAMLAFEMLYYANFGHIIAYSGIFVFDDKKEHLYKDNKVLIVHGDDDKVVPYSNMQLGYKNIESLGIKHCEAYTCYNLDHSISDDGVKKGLEFLLI